MKLVMTIIAGLGLLSVASTASIDPTCMLKEMIRTDERIRLNGYPAESHTVTTSDGYILNLFRIPYSNKLQNQNAQRPAILLQHGLFSNSDCWLSGGPDNALAYLLADAGFDVWMGNARGNIYSRQNAIISINSPKFWHFDWHEIGAIDIPTMIDYILEQTGESKIHYAGHSQGTTVYFVMMSEHSGRFCQMDYGTKKNNEIYGQPTPPDYNLENILAPTYFYSSQNDGLCNPKDVDTLVSKTIHLAGDYRVPDQTFNHLDFIVANHMREMVNDPVMQNIFKHEDSLY
uniref:Partial AB-hydrolase lipase domain-containing protein n=1 Tax=Stomoxys calcitrans TaxID=35570 RepID=A0A1I8P4Y5_STOCA